MKMGMAIFRIYLKGHEYWGCSDANTNWPHPKSFYRSLYMRRLRAALTVDGDHHFLAVGHGHSIGRDALVLSGLLSVDFRYLQEFALAGKPFCGVKVGGKGLGEGQE